MAGRFACPAAFLSFWEPICRAPSPLARGDALAWRATRQWERGLVSFRCASTIVRKSRCTGSCSAASRAEGATSALGSAEGARGCRARPGKLSACSADCATAELSPILSCTAGSQFRSLPIKNNTDAIVLPSPVVTTQGENGLPPSGAGADFNFASSDFKTLGAFFCNFSRHPRPRDFGATGRSQRRPARVRRPGSPTGNLS
jgi:hypothetical protein